MVNRNNSPLWKKGIPKHGDKTIPESSVQSAGHIFFEKNKMAGHELSNFFRR